MVLLECLYLVPTKSCLLALLGITVCLYPNSHILRPLYEHVVKWSSGNGAQTRRNPCGSNTKYNTIPVSPATKMFTRLQELCGKFHSHG